MLAHVRPVWVVSHNDYKFMQSFTRKLHRYQVAPDWAYNDEQMGRVVAAHVAILARVTTIPKDITMLRLLNRRAIKLLKKSSSWEFHKLARAAQRKGLPAYLTSIIYKTYRLGYDSVQCATDLGISPGVVRQTLAGLKNTAARLNMDRVIWKGYGKSRKKIDVKRALELKATGMTWTRIATELGASSQQSVYMACRYARKKEAAALAKAQVSANQPSADSERYAYA